MWGGSEGGWKCRVSPARAELAHGSPADPRARPAIFKDNTSTVKYYNILKGDK